MYRYYFDAYTFNEAYAPDMRIAEKKSFIVDVQFQSLQEEQGSLLADYIQTNFEGRIINDTVFFPTAENISFHLYHWAFRLWPDDILSVRVSDEPEIFTEYTRNPNE